MLSGGFTLPQLYVINIDVNYIHMNPHG